MGYVFTSSADFQQTIAGIIDGLQNSGFSAKDYRAAEIKETVCAPHYEPNPEPNLFSTSIASDSGATDPADEVDVKLGREILTSSKGREEPQTVAQILQTASQQNTDFSKRLSEEEKTESNHSLPNNVRSGNEARMKHYLEESASNIVLPVFEIKKRVMNKVLFDDADDEYIWVKLEKEHLYQGFDIRRQDKNMTFNWATSSAVKVDLEERQADEFVPKAWTLNSRQMQIFKSYIDSLAPEGKVSQLATKIAKSISGTDAIPEPHLVEYVKDVISQLDNEKLGQLTDNLGTTMELFNDKIKSLLNDYAYVRFERLRDEQEIRVSPTYHLPKVINPAPIDRHGISKSLYTEEGTMNDFESRVIRQVAALPNVDFWHRNLERGKGYFINGHIYHYPDFIVKLKSGKVVLIETKGDDRDNSDSRAKLKLGTIWAGESGKEFRYYMVFDHNDNVEGSLTLPQLVERIGKL